MEKDNIISATEANRSFSDLINKVYYQHQIFNIKKGRAIVAKIIPYQYSSKLEAKDLNTFFANSPRIDDTDRDEFISELNNIRSHTKVRDVKWD
jgi:hypothetical protein